jgi:ABC-2 type transport system permease protein
VRKLWVVIKREYIERVRTRWFLVATVFGPVVLGALMFLPAYMASRERPSVDVARIRIIDETNSDLGRSIAAELNGGVFGDTSLTQVIGADSSSVSALEATATRDVQARRLKGYLVLSRNVLAGADARYAGINATAIADLRALESVVEREVLAAELRAAGLSPADADRFKRTRFNLRAERITPTGRGGSGRVNIIFAISVATLLYITILMYGQAVLRGVIEEKQSRVAEVVVSSVRPVILLAGKVLGVGAVGLTQMVIWIVTTLLMAKYRVAALQRLGIDAAPIELPGITPRSLIVLLVFFLLGYTLYSGLFAIVGAMVSTEQEAQQAQMPVVLMLVVSLMFLQSVLNAPDGRLAFTLGMLPVSAPIVMPLRMSAVDVSPWEVAISILALVAACYLAVYVAARVYRTGLLMYGKRATVREVARWLRESK